MSGCQYKRDGTHPRAGSVFFFIFALYLFNFFPFLLVLLLFTTKQNERVQRKLKLYTTRAYEHSTICPIEHKINETMTTTRTQRGKAYNMVEYG